jgi:hypothetical protein
MDMESKRKNIKTEKIKTEKTVLITGASAA